MEPFKSFLALCVCSLSGQGLGQKRCENLASAIKSVLATLRKLELSGNILGGSLHSVLSAGLSSTQLEKLRSVSDISFLSTLKY